MIGSIDTQTGPAPSVRAAAIALGAAAMMGLAVGAATSYLQGILPGAANTLANSGAVWSATAMLIAIATARGRLLTPLLGTVALLSEVLGYYWTSNARGIPAGWSEQVLWTVAALVLGPFLGTAAWWLHGGDARQRLAATMATAGIVLGEGMHGLLRINRGGAQWRIELAFGLLLIAVGLAWFGRSLAERIAAAAGALAVALAIFIVYGSPTLLSPLP